jgi:hypothetical protein
MPGPEIRDELRFEPRWDLVEGWKRAVHELMKQGRL